MGTAFQAPRFPIDPRYLGAGLGLGVAAAILSQIPGLEMPHFDIDAVTPDLSLTPDVATPDTASTTIDGLHVSFIGEPVGPKDQAIIKELIKEAELAPEGGETYKVMLVPPEYLSEVVRMSDAALSGASRETVFANASPEAQMYLRSAFTEFSQGTNIIVTDRSVSFGVRLFPGERMGYFVRPLVH